MYLSGASNAALVAVCRAEHIGLILQPKTAYSRFVPEYPFWAADNGCFSQGASFNTARYLKWLGGLTGHRGTCLFATAPDVYGNAAMTLERSLPVLPEIRALGFKAALVAQDGLTPELTPWDDFDVLFLGGTDEPETWKTSVEAWTLTREALRRGVPIHMGRVNTLGRLLTAQVMGCMSADGTYLKYGPDVNLPKLIRWLRSLRTEPAMALEVA